MKKLFLFIAVLASMNINAQDLDSTFGESSNRGLLDLNDPYPYLTDEDTTYLRQIWDIYPYVGDDFRPPYKFCYKKNYHPSGTFYKIIHLNEGDSINVTCSTLLQSPYRVACYGKYLFDSFSESCGAGGSIHAVVPFSADYIVVAFSMNGNVIFPTITVNGETHASVRVAPDILPCPINGTLSQIHFTMGSTEDMMMCAFDRYNNVVGFSDDDNHYPATDSLAFDYGTEPRIYEREVAYIVVFPKDSTSTSVTTNVFARCDPDVLLSVGGFTNLRFYDAIATDDYDFHTAVNNYNSFSWACGFWRTWIDYTYNQSMDELDYYDMMFGLSGYTRTNATYANSSLDLYGHVKSMPQGSQYTNVAIKSSMHDYSISYDWESKLGASTRFMHPRDALTSLGPRVTGFGTRQKYYRKINGFVPQPFVFENIDFSDEELGQVERSRETVTPMEKSRFEDLYSKVWKTFVESCSSTLLVLEEDENYMELLRSCKESPGLMGLVYEKLNEGELVPCLIVYDVMMATDPGILTESRNQQGRNGDEGVTVLRTIQSEAIGCAKGLLARAAGEGKKVLLSASKTYSDDERILSVSLHDRSLTVRFVLDRASKTTFYVDTDQGIPVYHSGDGRRLEAGTHEHTVVLSKKGTYVVSLHVNGKVYTRKVRVN